MHKKSAPPTRKVKIKGKYLTAITEYVAVQNLCADFDLPAGPEADALIEAIYKLHGSILSKEDARHIVFRETYIFAAGKEFKGGRLDDPQNAVLRQEFTERLVTFLESLPDIYVLRVDLPSFNGYTQARYRISDQITLVMEPAIPEGGVGPLNKLAQLLNEHLVKSTHVEICASGFADSIDSPPITECISLAKQCAFILTTFGVFKDTYRPTGASSSITAKSTGNTLPLSAPQSLLNCYSRLTPDEDKLKIIDLTPGKGRATTLLGLAEGRKAETPTEKAEAFRKLLSSAIRFFETKEHPDFPAISAAIEWYHDSIYSDNQTFSYLAACIGLEALIGSDSQIENMSKRLADRYAFLMGKGRAEREKLVELYTKVLNVRGKIVHARIARLESDQRDLLRKVQKMLLDTIWHELHQMYRNTVH